MINHQIRPYASASVSDVLKLCSDPTELTVEFIAARLEIGPRQASELRAMAIRNFGLVPTKVECPPTAREAQLMRGFGFSRSEARLAVQMIDRGEVRA